jgi:hypothetical protein
MVARSTCSAARRAATCACNAATADPREASGELTTLSLLGEHSGHHRDGRHLLQPRRHLELDVNLHGLSHLLAHRRRSEQYPTRTREHSPRGCLNRATSFLGREEER